MKPAPEHFTKEDKKKKTEKKSTPMSSPRVISTRDQLTRFAKSLRGVLTGIALFIISLPILFLNESTIAQKHSDVQKGLRNVKTAEPVVNEYLENAIVHISGPATAPGSIIDQEFRIEYDGLKIKRIVEMLQWEEVSSLSEDKKTNEDDKENASFVYSKIWSDTIINSTEFNDVENYTNPNIFSLKAYELPADIIKLGGLNLSHGLINDLTNYEAMTIGQIGAANDDYTVVEQSTTLYKGQDYENPQIGDLRVRFEVIPDQTYTIVGEYEQGTLYPYVGNNRTLSLIEPGEVSRESMFVDVERTNHAVSWIMRFLGILIMFAGLWLMFGPITSLAALIPILGRVTRDATALLITITTAIFGFGIITLAWTLYQPAIGLPLLLVALLGLILYHFLIKQARKKIMHHVRQILGFAGKPIIDADLAHSKKAEDVKDAPSEDKQTQKEETGKESSRDDDTKEKTTDDDDVIEDIDGVSKEKDPEEIKEKSKEEIKSENKERAEDFTNESEVIEETPSKDDLDTKTKEELIDLQEDMQDDIDEKTLGDDIEDIAEDIAEAIEESIEKKDE